MSILDKLRQYVTPIDVASDVEQHRADAEKILASWKPVTVTASPTAVPQTASGGLYLPAYPPGGGRSVPLMPHSGTSIGMGGMTTMQIAAAQQQAQCNAYQPPQAMNVHNPGYQHYPTSTQTYLGGLAGGGGNMYIGYWNVAINPALGGYGGPTFADFTPKFSPAWYQDYLVEHQLACTERTVVET